MGSSAPPLSLPPPRFAGEILVGRGGGGPLCSHDQKEGGGERTFSFLPAPSWPVQTLQSRIRRTDVYSSCSEWPAPGCHFGLDDAWKLLAPHGRNRYAFPVFAVFRLPFSGAHILIFLPVQPTCGVVAGLPCRGANQKTACKAREGKRALWERHPLFWLRPIHTELAKRGEIAALRRM